MEKLRAAIDIGGTEIKGGIVDRAGQLVYRTSHPTMAGDGLKAITSSLLCVINRLKGQHSFDKIGISSAGQIDSGSGRVIDATMNLPEYAGFELAQFIKTNANLQAYCDNDAYCALLGEHSFGAAKNYKDVVMLTLGTGVGGAAIVDNKIFRGSFFGGARFGHMSINSEGIMCNCGKRGCAEAYLSGSAFTKGAIKQGFCITHGSQVFTLGTSQANEYITSFFSLLAGFIDSLCLAFDPLCVVIGGGMINSKQYFWQILLDECKKYNIKADILPAKLKNDAGIVGASTLIKD